MQQELDEALARAGLRRDPYGHVLDALGDVVGTFPDLVKHLEAARQPVRDEELRRAVIQGIEAHARDVVQAKNWRSTVIGVGMMAALLLIAAGGGYWFGYRTGVTSDAIFAVLSPADATTWTHLMAANPGSAKAELEECQAATQHDAHGRRACYMPIWIDPPNAIPATSSPVIR